MDVIAPILVEAQKWNIFLPLPTLSLPLTSLSVEVSVAASQRITASGGVGG